MSYFRFAFEGIPNHALTNLVEPKKLVESFLFELDNALNKILKLSLTIARVEMRKLEDDEEIR